MSDSDKAEQNKDSANADMSADIKPAENASTQTKSAQKVLKKSGPRAWPGMFVLMLFSATLGAGSAIYWANHAGTARIAQFEMQLAEIDIASGTQKNLHGDLNAVDERVGEIESRVEILENAPTTLAGSGASSTFDPRVGPLSERLSAIESAVPADLAARLNSFAPRDTQQSVIERLNELEQTNNGETLLRAGRILALSDLSRAATRSEPFSVALNAAAATLPEEQIFDVLRPHAAGGTPTPAQLVARFPQAARQALAAESSSEAENIFSRMWNKFTSLISIRRVGYVEGNDSGARLARAEAALDDENLAVAADEVAALQGAASQSMREWLEDVQARLLIETAIAGINARIVQMLADQTAPGQTTLGQTAPVNNP
jgi:hypothetical protein